MSVCDAYLPRWAVCASSVRDILPRYAVFAAALIGVGYFTNSAVNALSVLLVRNFPRGALTTVISVIIVNMSN